MTDSIKTKSKGLGKRFLKRLSAFFLAAVIGTACMAVPEVSIEAEAATSSKTAIDLAEFGLKAYADGWQYVYGAWGQLNSAGQRTSDCSGLIYAYLCWSTSANGPVANYSWPRGAQAQYNACTLTGSINTLPRTHGLLLFFPNCDHVGIYCGNGMAVDNSSSSVNMVYKAVAGRGWVAWGKLSNIQYPNNGWFKFNGNVYYYVDGEYVINCTKVIDGVTYTFNSAGIPSPTPTGYTTGDYIVNDDGSLPEEDDNCSLTYYTTATSGLNVRSSPSTSGSVVKVLDYGTKITVVNNSNSSWYKVKISSTVSGYVSTSYISTTNPNASATATPTASASPTASPTATPAAVSSDTATVNVDDLTLRATANYGSILGFLSKGTTLTVLDTSDSSWTKVKTSTGVTGYVYTSYITINSSSSGSSSSSSDGDIDIVPTVTATPVPSNTSVTAYVAKTTKKVYLYSEPSTSSTKITSVSKSSKVTVKAKNGSFYYVVTSGGKKGYIKKSYLSKVATVKGTTTTKINIYATRSTSGTVKGTISKSKKLLIIDYTSKSGWLKIASTSGIQGYVRSKYVKVSLKAKVSCGTGSVLNVRKSASSSGTVLKTVPNATEVTIIKFTNTSFYYVKLPDGTYGYVSCKYLTIS